ncbi:MAG: pirin family protein [Fimbriimonadaceae bacterium]|nr:pirin family protein [Alphaproteobacteria bacterium]
MSNTRNIEKHVQGLSLIEGAGVPVRRYLGTPDLMDADPFIMLDEFTSDADNQYLEGFPTHPHRGFETVTYMINGRSHHKDSTGDEGVLEAGDVQWMTAGRGILHSEMPEPTEDGLRGMQFWINLPAKMKMTDPRYQNIPSAAIRQVTLDSGLVRIIAVSFGSESGPAQSLTGVTLLDVQLAVGGTFELDVPSENNVILMGLEGEVAVGDGEQTFARGQLVKLTSGDKIHLKALKPARFMLGSGKPIGEPVARGGPFVMNTREEILRAFDDYRRGNLV